MRGALFIVVVASVGVCLVAATGGTVMQLTTTAFEPGGSIPARFTCEGDDVSPALSWSGAPEATASFVLIMDDPDAPPGTWVHWVLFNLPGHLTAIDEGVPETEKLGNGAVHGGCWGVQSFSRIGYYGPCPPPGKPHRYSFRLYALDATLDLAPRASKFEVMKAAEGHVLAEAELLGRYGR